MNNFILKKVSQQKSQDIYRFPAVFVFIILMLIQNGIQLFAGESYVSAEKGKGFFSLVSEEKTAPLFVSPQDYPGVHRITKHLQTDVERITGQSPEIIHEIRNGEFLVIIGTLGKSPVVDELVQKKKINADAVRGKWDTYALQTVENPLPGVDQALVIFGSNKRGTLYGMYDLSAQMGVSPWYFWADAPVQKKEAVYIKPGFYTAGEPKVKYRGIFINDEAPALRNWAKEQFGGFNHTFYEKVFELILRNRGNYLWPAMWLPTIFNEDDPENPRLADEMGIVISTSHHEPMMRSHNEWHQFHGGAWNYVTNKEKLQAFWRGGFERTKDFENVVTVGMRGDGDEGMSEETAIDLLKTIIADQREMIEDITGKPAEETPQVWAVYKEVQDYYDKGMRPDDDIMILFCDDNWGNLRILPKKEDLSHSGGYGIYYHFDYVGGPVSYRWLNANQIERTWEQMNMAYQWGVRDLWLVNVGDIKPVELPISFFLDFAWNPEAIDAEDLPGYYVNWSRQQFGDVYAEEIADVMALYTKYNTRRTPEMLRPETYSVENYREADRILAEFTALYDKAKAIYNKLPETHKAAFYQLALYPVEACRNVNEMNIAAAKNHYYGLRGCASANRYADKVKACLDKDAELTRIFHEDLADGKWNHMMSQTHIGYTYWNHPPANRMPAVSYIQTRKGPELGYLLEYGRPPRWGWLGVEGGWGFSKRMPEFDPVNDQSYYVEITNKGDARLDYTLRASEDWIKLSKESGSILFNEKVEVTIDWKKAPEGRAEGKLTISGTGREYTVTVPICNDLPDAAGFVENNGVISIEAANFTKSKNTNDITWTVVPNMGRTHSAMIVEPANADRQTPGKNAPCLEYRFTVFDDGDLNVLTFVSPTQNYQKTEGLKFAIAIDDETPQIININQGEEKPDWQYAAWWEKSVADHIKISKSVHPSVKAGKHTLKIRMMDPGIVFQKFVIDAGGLKPSYLGPPESVYVE